MPRACRRNKKRGARAVRRAAAAGIYIPWMFGGNDLREGFALGLVGRGIELFFALL